MSGLSVAEINELVISAYDKIADAYTGAYAENDQQDFKHFNEFIAGLVGKNVLDMGCGTGNNTAYLAKQGLNMLGIDASTNMLKVARRLFPDLKFDQQNILKTSFDFQSFDGIVLSYVINHFNQVGLTQLKKEVDRILADGGFLFISAHTGDEEMVLSDPLDESIQIYYNFLSIDILDVLFSGFKREYYRTRKSFGKDELLCDKMFILYKKEVGE